MYIKGNDKYKNRTMINEMKAFYNFENRIRRIHSTKRKAVNATTHVPTNTHKKFDITIIIQLYKLYDFNELYNSYNYHKFFSGL